MSLALIFFSVTNIEKIFHLFGSPLTDNTKFDLITGQGPDPEQVCLGPAAVCGFLTSGRKDFTA